MKKPFLPHLLPIKNLQWEKFIPLIAEANRQIALFDGLIQSMLNSAVLLSPLTTQEAVLSSKIEGTQATLQEVLQFEADPKEKNEKKDDIEEILNYRKAMSTAVDGLKNTPLSGRLIKQIHKVLLAGVRGQSKMPGQFRTGQVHIGSSRDIEQARFIPPAPNQIADSFSDLEKYFHYKEKDIIVQLAIIHAQFEIIHPFWDGNGRVGRMLLPLFLYDKKIISSPVFYLSGYLEANRDEYYDRLNEISREDNWNNWIIYFLQAVITQAKDNISKANQIHDLYNQKKEKIVNLTHSQFAIQVLDFIFSYPIFNSSQFIKTAKVPAATARRILKALEDGSVIKLIKKGKGRAPGIYAFPKLIHITG